jgi:hypothetical protein
LGVGGGVGITIGSGGTAALGGVALADVAIVAGGVYVGAGVADVLDGIVMMTQNNDNGGGWKRNKQNSQPSHSSNEKREFKRVKTEIKKELGDLTRKQEDAMSKAVHDAKDKIGSRETLPYEKLRSIMRNAVGLE